MPTDIRDILDEVYLRTLRTRPSGSRTAQRSVQHYVEKFGAEDDMRVVDVSYPVLDSLVSWWNMDTASVSGATLNDLWGGATGAAKNNGTITGATVDQGRVLDSLRFVTTSANIVTVTDHASLQNLWDTGATFEAWIRPVTSGENSQGRIYEKADGAGVGTALYVVESSGRWGLFFYRSFSVNVGEWQMQVPNFPDFNVWTHIVVTYNSSNVTNDPTIYINGVSRTLTEVNTPSGAATSDVGQNLRLGDTSAGTRGFDGFMDEVRIYSKILSQDEITHNYNIKTVPYVGSGHARVGAFTVA